MPLRTGSSHPNWKGGKTISSHGYVLLRRPDHPNADCRGYIYEHRLVAEQILGRPLKSDEKVHHIDEIKRNNSPENILVVNGNHEHFVYHRNSKSKRRLPGESNPIVKCECGCGTEFKKYDQSGRPRKYISGHNTVKNPRNYNSKKHRNLLNNKEISCQCGCGKKLLKYDKYGRERRYISGHNRKTGGRYG